MQNSLLVHKHLIIRAEAVRPPTDEEQLTECHSALHAFRARTNVAGAAFVATLSGHC